MKADYQQMEFIHPILRELLFWLEDSTGLGYTITSLYRIDDTGVHGTLPLRGADLRNRVPEIGEAIRDHVNRYWVYDPARPEMECCVLHGEGSNLHLHMQVHPNTRLSV